MANSYIRGMELMKLPPDQWPPGLAAYRERLDKAAGGDGESGNMPFVHYAHVIEWLPLTYHAYEPDSGDRKLLLRLVKEASAPPAEVPAAPPTADEIVGAAMKRLVLAVTDLIQADPHQWSTRPCPTCRAVSAIIGRDFGCQRAR